MEAGNPVVAEPVVEVEVEVEVVEPVVEVDVVELVIEAVVVAKPVVEEATWVKMGEEIVSCGLPQINLTIT